MFDPTSRYHAIENAEWVITEPDGTLRRVVYKKRRFLPPPESATIVLEHRVVEGDRVDNLAARYLGQPLQFWRVCDANLIQKPADLTGEVGSLIRIALPMR